MGDPPQNLDMAKPCDICGDVGYVDCIRVCCRCKITREHPYCMKIMDDGDPEVWVCEKCEVGETAISTITANPSGIICDQSLSPMSDGRAQPNNTIIRSNSNIRKPPRNTKVQYISPEEAMGLESGAQKKIISSPSKSNFQGRATVNRSPPPKTESSRRTIPPPKFIAKSNFHERPPGFTKTHSTRSPYSISQDKNMPGSKDMEKHVVQKQYDQQESPLAIRLSAKNAETSNATMEERNRRAQPLNRGTSTGTPLHHKKILTTTAERITKNTGHAFKQSLHHLLDTSSDKGPARQQRQETSATKLSVSGKCSKTNAGRENMDPGHTSPQLVQDLPAVCSDKGPARQPHTDTSAGMTLHLEKFPEPNTEIIIEKTDNSSVQSHLLAQSSGTGVEIHVDTQRNNFGSEGKESSGVVLELDRYLLNHPAEFPTWKGKFIIPHADILRSQSYDEILAHPPCKVHRKVYNLSKKLPETLHFELLPRSNIWLMLFNDEIPCALDIGLYFLSLKRTSLVDFMDEHDNVLRSQIDGVELFVISSRHLPEDSQRINKELFLWGLFRSFDDRIVALAGESDEDMDIDMPGGCEVGIIDMAVPKPAEDTSADPTVPELTLPDRERPDGTAPVLPLTTTTFEQSQLQFEKELQRCFDRFVMLKQPDEVKVKEVGRSPGRH